MSENTVLTNALNGTTAAEQQTYRPQVNIFEVDDNYVLVADVPGAGEGDIDLSVEKDVLTLTAKVEEPRFDGFEPRWRGYGVGDWKRSFRLGDAIERDGVDATIKDGVLRVTLPKAKESLRKSIPVKRLD